MNRQRRKKTRTDQEQALWRFEKDRRSNLLAVPGKHDFILVLDNLKPDFNIGKIFRSADAFGAREIHLIGIKHFDPAPAAGSFKWVPARFHDDFDSCFKALIRKEYCFFALEPEKGTRLTQSQLPLKSAFVLGHEEFGLSFDLQDYGEISQLQINQYGKVQSLNVSVAASIVMYEYVSQNGATP